MYLKTLVITILAFLLHACGGGGGSGAPATPPAVNRAPVALDQNEGTDPGVVLNGSLLASDADGDSLSYSIVSNPVSGTVTLGGAGNQTFTYTPNGGFAGADSFSFQASDGELTSNTATATINVNFKPVATGTRVSTSEAASISGAVSATDNEGDGITYVLETSPIKGSVTAFNSTNGVFTYSPNPVQDGTDSFRVVATDAFQASDPAVVNVEIFNWADNQQFGTAVDDFATTNGFFADADGSFIFGGLTNGQISATPSAGDADAWLRKADRRGNELWTVQFGDAGSNTSRVIAPAPDGSGTFVLRTTQIVNIAASIFKFDNDGNELLDAVIDFGTGTALSVVYQGAVDDNGDVWVLSWNTDNNSLITKVSGITGNTVWQNTLENSDFNAATPTFPNSSDIRVRSVDFDSAGNAIVAGWLVDDATLTRICNFCGFLSSYDTDGNLLWQSEIDDYPFACAEASEGRVYRIAVADDDTIWISGHGGLSPSPDRFAQVSKYNADGTQILWSSCTTASTRLISNFTPIRHAANGDGLLLSTFEAEIDPVSGLPESSELILSRIDPDGNTIFARSITATRTDGSPATFFAGDLFEDGQGLIYVSGTTDGEITSGSSVGEDDVFLMRFDADGNPLL